MNDIRAAYALDVAGAAVESNLHEMPALKLRRLPLCSATAPIKTSTRHDTTPRGLGVISTTQGVLKVAPNIPAWSAPELVIKDPTVKLMSSMADPGRMGRPLTRWSPTQDVLTDVSCTSKTPRDGSSNPDHLCKISCGRQLGQNLLRRNKTSDSRPPWSNGGVDAAPKVACAFTPLMPKELVPATASCGTSYGVPLRLLSHSADPPPPQHAPCILAACLRSSLMVVPDP